MTTKKFLKSDFYKNKKIKSIDDIDVDEILVPKKNHSEQKIPIKTLLDIMIMMQSDHYV